MLTKGLDVNKEPKCGHTAECQRVRRTVEQDAAEKRWEPSQPGPVDHRAEFRFILRTERSNS